MGVLKMLTGMVLVLGAGTQAIAQTAPAIVECKWSDGAIESYKVSSTIWENWDPVSWSWRERACNDVNGLDVKCTVSISSEQYLWEMRGKQFIDNGRTWLSSHVNSYIKINRISGGSVYTYQFQWESHKQTSKTTQNDRTGTCQGAKDPALLPKPAPPVPKF